MPLIEQPAAVSHPPTFDGSVSPLQIGLRYLLIFEWFVVIVVGFAALVLLVVCLLYVIYADALPEMTRSFGPLCLITGVSTGVAGLGFAAARSLQRRNRLWPMLQAVLLIALIGLGVTISVTMGAGGE